MAYTLESNSLKQVRLVFCLPVSATLKMEDMFYFLLSTGYCEDLWNNGMYFLLIFNAWDADDVSYTVPGCVPKLNWFWSSKCSHSCEQVPGKVSQENPGNHFKILHGCGLPAKWLICFSHHSAFNSCLKWA